MNKTVLPIALLALSAAAVADSGYLTDSQGNPVWSGAGHCWRTAAWTPAHASRQCDPALVPKVAQAPQPQPAPAVVPAPAPRPAPVPQRVRHSFEADPLFDFDSPHLRDSGKAKLDALAAHLAGMSAIETATVIGHSDRLGAADYNQRLSEARAMAVRDYLVAAGVPAERIRAEGRGETEPLTAPDACPGKARTPAQIACLQPDRRVDVDLEALAAPAGH